VDNGGIFRVTASDGSTTNNVTISGLSMTGGHAMYFGGAVYNFENLTITGCSLSLNSSSFGGAIYSTGNLTILNSQIFNNTASLQGGGIDSIGALTVQNSSITGNSSFGGFGGYRGGGFASWSPPHGSPGSGPRPVHRGP